MDGPSGSREPGDFLRLGAVDGSQDGGAFAHGGGQQVERRGLQDLLVPEHLGGALTLGLDVFCKGAGERAADGETVTPVRPNATRFEDASLYNKKNPVALPQQYVYMGWINLDI